MINTSKAAMMAALIAIGFASPAFALSVPGYAADGSVVALGQGANARQSATAPVIQRSQAFGSVAAYGYGIPGYGPAGNVVTIGQR
jgi:hypothetical protein